MTEARNTPEIGLPKDRPQTTPWAPAQPGQQQEQAIPGNDPQQQGDAQGKEQLQK